MVSQERCVSIIKYRINIGKWRVIREEEPDVLLFFYWLVDDILVQKFLSLYLIWGVAPDKLRKLHLKNPVNVQIIKNYVKNVGLRTLSVVQKVVQKFEDVFWLHHAVKLICLEVSNQLNDTVDLWLVFGVLLFELFPGLNMVSNEQFEPKFCFKPKSLVLVKLEKLL